MQLFLFALQVKVETAADALAAERRPLLQQLTNAQYTGRTGNENIEIAAEAVLQRRHAKQLLHQLVRVGTALAVNGQLQAAQIGLIAHIADLPHLPQLDQINDLIHDRLYRRRGRDLRDLNAVVGSVVIVAAAHPHAAPSGGIDLVQLRLIVQQDPAAGEVRCDQGICNIVLRITDQGCRRLTDLRQIERADIARHTHRNAGIVVHQHRGEGHRQQRRLLHGVIVVIHKVYGILFNIRKELPADLFQPYLGISVSGISHVAGVRLAEVALAVHKGHQQRFVTARHAYHRLIDGRIAMGVQLHSFSHHTGRFCPRSG